MAQYLSRFIKDFASISAPIRQITCKDAKWVWGPQQQQAFDSLKANMIAHPNIMKYFDPLLETELVVAASPIGLGAILTQVSPTNERHVIAYASRSLTDRESRYSQTEREALAAVWGVEHFSSSLRLTAWLDLPSLMQTMLKDWLPYAKTTIV